MDKVFDVIIIGGGIVGCAAARSLSRYALDILLLEKGSDVSVGATKANSGILHAGYDCEPGTLKAELNKQGLRMYTRLVEELNIPHRINGSLVVSTYAGGLSELQTLYNKGVSNGVTEMEILTAEQARALEPNLHPTVNGALRATSAGIISPYEAAIAFAENAAVNGVSFLLDTTVTGITSGDGGPDPGFTVSTSRGDYRTRAVINCAGTESGNIANFLRGYIHVPPIVIHPQRGQYYLLDNTQRGLINHTVFQLPTHMGKGVLIAPTVDGNILLGPTAEAVEDPQATETTGDGLHEALTKVSLTLSHVPVHDRITAFAGIRVKHAGKDFIVEESPVNFFHAIGIDSPGLTAAPAIAARLADMALARLQPAEKTDFVKERPAITRFRDLSPSEQNKLIAANPAYGQVVCRCETITQAEIMDAMRRPIPAKNLDALKRRTRAQMGRCQGGFCTLKLVELLSRELGIPESQVTKNGPGSEVVGK
ncbi:MAG: NAD(P)/FAD-dependent oxidoreductase [Defluviitaleaceae bacterium]|nr:NAD(P)/FAD-dependent oxidoreductase [Defluviitaleaceae bacterium]